MKFLFVVKSKIMENLGVMYLSAVLKKHGKDCRITDIDNAPQVYLDWSPNCVGYSIMTGNQEKFFELNRLLMAHSKTFKPFTFAGGPHPTFFPDDPMLKEYDYIVKGEAEQFFSDYFQLHDDFRDINKLPHPDRKDFPGMKIRDFIASRGCPHDCAYCYNRQWAQLHPQFKRVRIRDAYDVCSEVETVSPEFAYFQDSCFAVNIKWMKEFVGHYCRIPYHCHLRPKQVTGDMVELLETSNCASIRMALESASDRLRKLMNRPALDTQNVINASLLLRKHNIQFMIQNILAIPTSTIEDDLSTLEFNIRCQPSYAWSSIFSPYPGTVLGNMCVEKGWYKGDYSDITESFFDRSVLEFSDQYKEQSYVLQKIFALCVETQYLPKAEELYLSNLPKLVHNASRKLGDHRLYKGII